MPNTPCQIFDRPLHHVQEFILQKNPRSAVPLSAAFSDCVKKMSEGVTSWKSIKNATFPAEGAGNQTFDNRLLYGALLGVPAFVCYNTFGFRWWWFGLVTALFALPILAVTLYLTSRFAPRYRNYVKLPNKPLEEYITIKDAELKSQYYGRNKIPMETFFEAYFEEKIDFVEGKSIIDIMEQRHDWADFHFTLGQFKFFLLQWIPETIWHSRGQDETQVRAHYDRGDDFYEAFLGERMVYTSGIITDANKSETLEEMQDNKMKLICEKIGIQKGEKHLDIGCGWGTLVRYAAKNYGSDSTGVTLSKNQAAYGNGKSESEGLRNANLLCKDYRDIPKNEKYDKITCVEMAEHVGLRRFSQFLHEVRELLDDDGMFYMQVAGLRATWQYEDFIWGLFMARYIFPGADASTPLYWYINQLETAGFEIHNVDTVGVHYSATLHQWYLNWQKNRPAMKAKYGEYPCRIWDIFLSWSTIIARQGSATCFQITAHKNRNGFDRAKLICARTNPTAWMDSKKN